MGSTPIRTILFSNFSIFHVFFSKLLINQPSISKYFQKNQFSKLFIKLASFYHDRSDLNDKTKFVFSRISQSIMGLPYGVSPNPFMYIFKTSLLIFKHKQTSSVCFHSFVYTPNLLVLKGALFPVKLLSNQWASFTV